MHTSFNFVIHDERGSHAENKMLDFTSHELETCHRGMNWVISEFQVISIRPESMCLVMVYGARLASSFFSHFCYRLKFSLI
jgi:hypothetical protein